MKSFAGGLILPGAEASEARGVQRQNRIAVGLLAIVACDVKLRTSSHDSTWLVASFAVELPFN
jgi:hypothetical protein